MRQPVYNKKNYVKCQKVSCLWEQLHADDLVTSAESIKELEQKFLSWKSGLENHDLRVNFQKTKIMHCKYDERVKKDTGKFSCSVLML